MQVFLAKEAGLLYSAVAMATDYDCWRDAEDSVCASDVIQVFKKNVDKVTRLLAEAVKLIGQQDWDQPIDQLHVSPIFSSPCTLVLKLIGHLAGSFGVWKRFALTSKIMTSNRMHKKFSEILCK